MTIERASGPIQYEVLPPPAANLADVVQWAYEQFSRLFNLQQQPMVQALQFARVESATDVQITRPAPGMVVYAAAAAIGAGKPEGLYIYLGGAWKQLQTI